MKIVIVGGKLQGVEATYLARQAGWEVVLIDKDEDTAASGLCDSFHQLDVRSDYDELVRIVQTVQLVVPAVENIEVLDLLGRICSHTNVPLAYDPSAYAISSSKRKSDQLFLKHNIPAPIYWPTCNFPVIVKPSNASGSEGVSKIADSRELSKVLEKSPQELNDWVIQEYIEGPSHSLEVVGYNGNYLALQTTDLQMDEEYDCKRVLAPTELKELLEHRFRAMAIDIAKAINLNGIMDVEVINHQGTLKVLEIDARLPSQTPIVVYKSTGINMLKLLYDVYVRGCLEKPSRMNPTKAVVYEHIKVSGEGLEVLGEHIMASVGPLSYYNDFFGADEALTNFKPGCISWVATLIITGNNRKEVWQKHCKVIDDITKNLKSK